MKQALKEQQKSFLDYAEAVNKFSDLFSTIDNLDDFKLDLEICPPEADGTVGKIKLVKIK